MLADPAPTAKRQGPPGNESMDQFHDPRPAVLDVREPAAFAAGHLPGAASRPLERAFAAQLPARREEWLAHALPSIFLPPRHVPLLVVASDGELASELAALLTLRGRVPVSGLGLTAAEAAALPAGRRHTGPSRAHLWQPPDFLRRWWRLLPPPAAGPVLDLACGSGRAAVWLAERGWRVTGVDHQPEALALARALAADRGVAPALLAGDLREPHALPPGPWAAVLLFRFLDRPLMARLPGVLAPDAVVMLHTFREAPGYLGNPRPRHRLARGEATRLLPAPPAEVLVHEEGFDADGRPSAGAVVRWRRDGRQGCAAGSGQIQGPTSRAGA